MAKTSIVRPISGPAGITRSGSVWLKWIRPSDGAPATDVVLAKEEGAYSIERLGGNATQLRATIAATPGANGAEPSIAAYMVPGDFTPSETVPFPPGTPITATFNAVKGLLNTLDHLEYAIDLVAVFSASKAQMVLLSSTGAYCVIPYDQESLPQLNTANITSAYPGGRTGFTSGDVVNLSFTASASVSELAVWPHGSVIGVDGLPTGTPQYVAVSPAGTTGTVSVTLAAISSTAYSASGKLYVAARQYGQISTPIQTTTAKVFDERTPSFSGASASIVYPVGQSAIKLAEQATVSVSGVTTDAGGQLAGSVVANFSGTNRLAPVGTPPFTVAAGAASFAVTRGASGFNGRAYLQLTATNSNNGKTAASSATFVGVDLQDTGFADPALTVNGGNTISTSATGTNVSVVLASVVELINPLGFVTLPNVTITSWSTSDGGYTWTATGSIADTAPRNTYTPNVSGLLTAAGTSVASVTGSYKISGFLERAFTVSPAFATQVNLGALPVDYAAGLVVKDLAFQPTTRTYTAIGNYITLTDPVLTGNNASGAMPVYISQAPLP